MWTRARSQAGFTTIELLLAVLIGSAGVIALVGTFDVSQRVTNYAEMKEAASHVAEQKMEELRAVDYAELALDGTPAASADPESPAYYVGGTGTTYRWNQASNADADHTEPLVVDAVAGTVPATVEAWNDGRIKGKVFRYVTCAAATVQECEQGPETSAYKRVTVAVTVDNKLGPREPILVSTVIGNPSTANGEGANPLDSPNTQCENEGVVVECSHSVAGSVRTWYLYDTPATALDRQEIAGSHPTHPTVAPAGTCTAADTTGCPVPDLMGLDPAPDAQIVPPLYNYSNEITGGSTPGGTVIRRDAACTGTVTTTDNTKGHMWVTAPLAAPITVTGDIALSVSTQTFNGVTAGATLCVRLYNVPGNISNLVASPPTAIGSGGYALPSWPSTASELGFSLDVLGAAPGVPVPAGNRLGVRMWAAASASADLVVLYDHAVHQSFVQINEAE